MAKHSRVMGLGARPLLASLLLSIVPFLYGFNGAFALDTINESRLTALEQRLLQRQYARDPLDKRLQRLELLVFGATQFGGDSERFAHLQRAVTEQSAKSTLKNKSAGKRFQDNSPNSSKEAVAIGELEKEILKQSFAIEPASKRLDRLEAKLFGQASPNMPSANRVERLRRAAGLDSGLQGPQTAIRPFSEEHGMMPNSPFSNRFNVDPFGAMPGLDQSDPQMTEMMKQMQRQLRQLEGFGGVPLNPKVPNLQTPNNGQFDIHFFYQDPDGKSRSYHFGNPPGLGEKPEMPKNPQQTKKSPIPGLKVPDTNEIPPYGDPNMI
jgi:hypothetical protein